VGVLENEQHAPQRVRINLDMYIEDDRNVKTHELPDVVCYDQIIQKVTSLMNEGRFRLLETAGNQIAELCLEDVRISSIRIMLEKLDVYTNAGSVGIEIWRSRPTTESDVSFARSPFTGQSGQRPKA
jgi:dihydroneopterin aldolase